MEAVLLAAGKGLRLRPLTATLPKPLLPVRGRPCIVSCLDAMARASVQHVTIVIGHLGDQFEPALHPFEPFPFEISFVVQPHQRGTSDALRLALESRPHWPTPQSMIVCAADYYYEDHVLAHLAAAHAGSGADISVYSRKLNGEVASRKNAIMRDENEAIVGIVEKPTLDPLRLYESAALVYIIPTTAQDACLRTPISTRGEYEIASTINILLAEGAKAEAFPLSGLTDIEEIIHSQT